MKTIILLLSVTFFSNCGKSNHLVNMEQEQPVQTSIITYVKNNQLDAVEKALKEGANVNTKDGDGRSLLLLATRATNYDMAKLLVSYGADVNLQDNMLDSPFLYAGATGQTTMLRLFLAHGARFDIFNRYNGTALIPACERGHVETVKLLTSTKGFPIDHINRLGWTALLEAVILGDGSSRYQEIVGILKAAGCDISIADNDGKTPLQHAKAAGYSAIVKVLEAGE